MICSASRWFLALLIAVTATLLLIPVPAAANPASPDPVSIHQPDGRSFTAFIRGDECQGWVETEKGYTIVQRKPTGAWEYAVKDAAGTLVPSGIVVSPGLAPPKGTPAHLTPPRMLLPAPIVAGVGDWDPVPVSGQRRVIIILVNFADRYLITSPSTWNATTFDTTLGQKSVANFYNDNSYGIMTLQPVVWSGGWAGLVTVTVPQNHPDSSNNWNYSVETAWINSALSAASSSVDFAVLDTDSDGILQPSEVTIYFILAGYEASGTTNTPNIWAHAWGGPGVSVQGKQVPNWALNGELNGSTVQQTMGVICHELGHSLCGLPDLYDTGNTNAGLGIFSLMSSGSWGYTFSDTYAGATPVGLDAWSREYLGWSTPRTYASGLVSFPLALSSRNASFKLANYLLSPVEYFLIENRYSSGWDEGMERWIGSDWGGGLLIQHIDISVGTPGSNDINLLVPPGYQGVMAEEASSAISSPSTSYSVGDVTNLFYSGNNASFTDTSAPNSRLYSGISTNFSVTTISIRAQTMFATIVSADPPPTVLSVNRQNPTNQYTSAASVVWRVTFSEAVTGVDTTDFTVTALSGSIAGYSVSSVTTVNTSTYDVTVNTGSGDGELRLDVPATAIIYDLGNNAYSSNFTSGQTYIVDDITPPLVSSVNRQDPTGQYTNQASVVWRVTFSEPVTETSVDITDFTVTKLSGAITGYSVASVTTVNASTYDVLVATGWGGDGWLRLDVPAAAIIYDLGNNDYNSNFTSGQTYRVDKTPPVVSSINRRIPTGQYTSAASVVWRVTFNEAVTDVDASDFTLTPLSGALAGYFVSPVATVNPATYDVTVNTGGGDGELRLDVGATAIIRDLASLLYNSNYTLGQTYIIDKTGPVISVTDDGAYQTSTSQLHASWVASDPVSGVAEISYAIGTGATYIVPWKSAGLATEATEVELSLYPGTIYYWYVKARDTVGNWSVVVVQSDGIAAVEADHIGLTISEVKYRLSNSESVGLSAKAVTGVFGNVFYVEEGDRSSGIRVEVSSVPAGLGTGKLVDVGGTLSTNADGERVILGTAKIQPGSAAIGPLGMVCRSLGGSAFDQYPRPPDEPVVGQQGIEGASGVNNIGLLVRIWGSIVEIEPVVEPDLPTWFVIDDGSDVAVKCFAPGGVTIEPDWTYLCVTGISSCEKIDGQLRRLLRVLACTTPTP